MRITKAVIAVAGYGTRFLPATKAVPKELLPIVSKPAIQYLVEEAVQAGIEDIILVTRPGTQAIADHFDSSRELEIQLEEANDTEHLRMVRDIPALANFAFVRQGRDLPYGNGSPLLAARSFISRDEPFVYMFGDDMVMGDIPAVKQLVDVYEKHRPGGVIAVQQVPQEETHRYGIVKLKPDTEPAEMESIIEKPAPGKAPSRLAQFGRFVFSPRIIEILQDLDLGKDNELWLADAVDKLSREAPVLVQQVQGTWFTIGDPLRFLIANVEYALRDPHIGKDFAAYLKTVKLPK